MVPTCFRKELNSEEGYERLESLLSLEGEEDQSPDGHTNISVYARVPPTSQLPWQYVSLIDTRQQPRGLWRQ